VITPEARDRFVEKRSVKRLLAAKKAAMHRASRFVDPEIESILNGAES
jgi:hypothetical protein